MTGDGRGRWTVRKVLIGVLAVVMAAVASQMATPGRAYATDGDQVEVWGGNEYGEGTLPDPAPTGVIQVSAGVWHNLVLRSDGSAVAWGRNDFGQTTVPTGAQSGVTQVAAGSFHSVALKSDGSVVAWGFDSSGQSTVPAEAQSGVTQVDTAYTHNLALKSDGSVVAWGWNLYGTTTVPTAAQSGVVQVAAGYQHSLALKSDGSVVAWGNSDYGQATVPVEAQSGVTQIAAGAYHSLALKSDGGVVAWGRNEDLQRTVPAAARSGVVQIAAGSFHNVALKSDGSLVAWGRPDEGQATVPAAAAGALQVSAGGYHNLALVAPATVAFGDVARNVREDAGVVKLTVARGGNTAIPVAVDYARTSGTATPGADFTLTAGTLHFAAGQSVKTIPVTITDDSTREPDESIVVSLSAPAGRPTLEAPTRSVVTIGASDQRPDLLVSTAPNTAYVGNNVYNSTGAGQTRSLTGRRTQTRTFYVRVGNDGNVRNTFAVKGSKAQSGSTVRVYSGATDITSALSSTAGWRVTLAPAAYKTLTVRIKVLRGAAIGSSQQASVKATWTGDGVRVDLANAVVKVVR